MSESKAGIVMDVEDRTSLYESLADAKKHSPVNMRHQKGTFSNIIKDFNHLSGQRAKGPKLVACNMTSPDKEATLEHVRGLACCRFQWDDSSKAWDLYYHADPELEHEVAERAWDQEFTLALVNVGGGDRDLSDRILNLGSLSADLFSPQGPVTRQGDSGWLHPDLRPEKANDRRAGAIVSEVGLSQSLPSLFEKALEWATDPLCKVVIITKIYERGLQPDQTSCFEPHLEVYALVKRTHGLPMFIGPTSVGAESTCNGRGRAGHRMKIRGSVLFGGTTDAAFAQEWIILDCWTLRLRVYQALSLEPRMLNPAFSGVSRAGVGRGTLSDFVETHPTVCALGPVSGGQLAARFF